VVEAHKGPVNALYTRVKEVGMISGGNDGMILFWDQSLSPQTKINIKTAQMSATLSSYKIRSICESKIGKLLIGTRGSEIIEME